MTHHRKIKDSTLYNIYQKLYSFYDVDKYATIEDFIDDLQYLNYPLDSDTNIIITTLLKKNKNLSQSDYLLLNNFDNHSILLIMVCNTNFIYLLENPDKTFNDVFGNKYQFHLTSIMVDIIGSKEIEKLNE